MCVESTGLLGNLSAVRKLKIPVNQKQAGEALRLLGKHGPEMTPECSEVDASS